MTTNTNTTTTTTTATPAAATGLSAIKVLPFDKFVFFSPMVSNYTGSKKLVPEDIGLTKAQLPPAELAKLGTISSCDPKKVQKFESYRAAQRNVLLKYGTRAMGLYAVPEGVAAEAARELDSITAEFYVYKEEFIRGFEADRAKWLKVPEFAKWVDAITARLDPIGHIEKTIQCDWFGFTIGASAVALDDDTTSALAKGLMRAKDGIGDQVLQEISVIAKTVFAKSLHDDDGNKLMEVTQRILSPIKRIKEKLDALAFSDPRLSQVSRYITSVLCLLPTSGKLSSNELMSIYNLVHALCDPQTIVQIAEIGATASAVMTSADAQQILDIVATPTDTPHVDSTPVEDELGAESGATASGTPFTFEVSNFDEDVLPVDGEAVYDPL